jgi:hypothetical protein
MKKLPRKRRTREHVIADLAVNHVERHALLCGFLFTAGQSMTVQVPVKNALTTLAMRRFARFRDRVLEQMRSVIHDED